MEADKSKDYIAMYPMAKSFSNKPCLVSECFHKKQLAEDFAIVMAHNYGAKTTVRETFNPSKYVVFAEDIDNHLILSNFQDYEQCYIFANWKYTTRKRP